MAMLLLSVLSLARSLAALFDDQGTGDCLVQPPTCRRQSSKRWFKRESRSRASPGCEAPEGALKDRVPRRISPASQPASRPWAQRCSPRRATARPR